ncbi:MAG: PP2C family protein-serine/threonine phosphatase, partial [Thermoanaerobaculia bacterium]
MTNTLFPADHRGLMRKIEALAEHIERDPGEILSIRAIATKVIFKLRDELGISGGRLYELDGDDYLLRAAFPDAKEVDTEIRIPRTYPPLEICLMRGSVYMTADDPLVDRELEAGLGVRDFAAVEIGNEQYVLGFDVVGGNHREEVLYSLGVIRHSINRKIRQNHVAGIFRQARAIQTSILPAASPRFGDFDIAGRSLSIEEAVGGDLYDYIPITDKILGLAIADASGHGLPAALQVRDIYTGLRMGLGRDFKIVRTVERLNDIIHASTLTSRFVSMFYGELELNGLFIGVNAGHPPPFHLAADGEVSYLDRGGPVLGPLPDAIYDRSFAQMQPGDMLVMFTDGITEALRDGNGEEYRVERLVEVAKAQQGHTAAEVIDAVFADLETWSAGAPLQDDCT